jgi:hypothetical protein
MYTVGGMVYNETIPRREDAVMKTCEKCGRPARVTFETRVGLTRKRRACGSERCVIHITGGYPVHNVKAVSR